MKTFMRNTMKVIIVLTAEHLLLPIENIPTLCPLHSSPAFFDRSISIKRIPADTELTSQCRLRVALGNAPP
jgi:hypothetical protein